MPRDLRVEAVLFDLYQTLLDIETDERDPLVWEGMARFLRYRGLRADAGNLYTSYFTKVEASQHDSTEEFPSVDVVGVFGEILLELGDADRPTSAEEVSQILRTLSMRRFDVFSDVIPTLQALHGRVKLGLVSNAQRAFLAPEIRMTGLETFLDAIVISSDHGFNKPDARLFAAALDILHVNPDRAVYVGDSPYYDVGGARNAGVRAVLVNRPDRPIKHAELYSPDVIVSTLTDLPDILGEPLRQR